MSLKMVFRKQKLLSVEQQKFSRIDKFSGYVEIDKDVATSNTRSIGCCNFYRGIG